MMQAAVGGVPIAALPLDGGPAIADPFKRTVELVSLLELRAAQLTHRSSSGVLAGVLRWRRSPVEPVGRLV